MDCITPLSRDFPEPDGNALTTAFHLLVLERALRLLADAVQDLPTNIRDRSFAAAEAPAVIEEALGALAEIKEQIYPSAPRTAP